MTNQQYDDAIFGFLLSTGGASPQQIQAWTEQSNMDPLTVRESFAGMLKTGRIYYLRKGFIVANIKKAGNVRPVQQQTVKQAPQGRANPFGGNNYRPPGVGRMRL